MLNVVNIGQRTSFIIWVMSKDEQVQKVRYLFILLLILMCKAQILFDIQTIMEMEEIPYQLVIDCDHTGINYVPISTWTMAKEGSKRVEIAGIGDK